MTPQELEASAKGEQLAARIEHLYQTDEEFRCWYQQGIDEIEAGQMVTLVFRDGKWEEL